MSVKSLSSDAGLSRRSVLATLSGSVAAVALARTAWAQDVAPTADTPEVSAPVPEVMPEPVAEPIGPQPFSFDWLDARMAQASQSDYQVPVAAPEVITDLDYDDYRKIQFNPTRARWRDEGVLFQVHAFHPGWLYKDTVTIPT